MDYRRLWCKGGTYFFTVNLQQRQNNNLLTEHIDLLRQAVRQVKHAHPFIIHAWVILPEHMHCIIELPEGDANFALRWRLIKLIFSRDLPDIESRCSSRQNAENEVSGNADTGNTWSEIKPISTLIWTMYILIRWSMAGYSKYQIGLTQPSICWLSKAYILQIGLEGEMISYIRMKIATFTTISNCNAM